MGRWHNDCTESTSGILADVEKQVILTWCLAQFDFYSRMIEEWPNCAAVCIGNTGEPSFCEQIENFGLPNPAEYGFNARKGSIKDWNTTHGWNTNGIPHSNSAKWYLRRIIIPMRISLPISFDWKFIDFLWWALSYACFPSWTEGVGWRRTPDSLSGFCLWNL